MTKEFKMTKYYVKYASIAQVRPSFMSYLNYDADLDDYYFDSEVDDMYVQTEFTSADIVKLPAPIQEAIGKGVLVLEEVE